MRYIVLSFIAVLSACQTDETVAGYGASDKVWHLREIDHKPFEANATLTFPEAGRIAGKAPCNQYFAEMNAPYPWFKVELIGATKMACQNLSAEDKFFEALNAMSLSETLNNTLILSNDDGREMVFEASQ